MLCKICKKQFDTYKKLARHIKDYHKMTSQQYFDLYLATDDNNHLCPICGNETKFINLNLGYHKTCCHTCHSILQNNNYSNEELEIINTKRKTTWNNKDLTNYKQLQSDIQTNRWSNYSEEERQIIKNKQKDGFLNMSVEAKENQIKKISIKQQQYMNNLTEEQLTILKTKISDGLKQYYTNLSKEEKELFRQSCKDRMNNMSEEKKQLMRKHQSESLQNKSKEEWAVIKQKEHQTRQKNGTFNTSKPEDNCYNLLLTKFEVVNRNYKSKEYPYLCDFYIPSLNLYIECHFHWTHGTHPYMGTKEDLKIIDFYKTKHKKYYDIAIYVWSILDVKKLQIAKENKLNYLSFYTENDFISWFETL